MLKHDLSQYYELKSTIEDLFGKKAWYEIKECTNLRKWKKYCTKILQAIVVASEATVTIADNGWHQELKDIINRGKININAAKEIDEVMASLAATLTEASFHQLGFMPHRKNMEGITLHKRFWQLDNKRTVQYVQNSAQAKDI